MKDIPATALSTGFLTLEGGVNSGRVPTLLDSNQVSFAINTTFRGGYAAPRPGWIRRDMTYPDYYTPASDFNTGRFQGVHPYTPPDGNPLLVMSVSGRIYAIDLENDYAVTDVTPAAGGNSANRTQVWMIQAEDWLIIQDGESRAIIFDGAISRRARDNEIPTGTAMAYGLGRIWVAVRGKQFVAGDIFGGPSGTPANQYRDAILKFTENTYLNEGGAFSLPINAGDITGMKFTQVLNTALGQGELLVSTDQAVFSVNVPVDRTQWKNLTYPIQKIALIKYGAASQNSMEHVNGDVYFRAQDGVRSLVMAVRQFDTVGNTPISREMNRALKTDEKWLLKYASSILFDERLITTCDPHIETGQGIYHRGLAVLDFDPLSSNRDKAPPAWDGLWTGLKWLQLTKTVVRDDERAFGIVLSKCDVIELWEITRDHRFDNVDGRITWTIETPSYTWDSPFSLKRLQGGDIWVDRVAGSVSFDIDFRSDQYPAWLDWHSWTECAEYQDCYAGYYGTCRTLPLFSEQYRPRMRLPQPPDTCDSTNTTFTKLHRDGYEFAMKFTIVGHCRLRQMRMHATLQAEPKIACQPDGSCKTLSLCDSDPFTYASSDDVCPVVPPPPPAPAFECPECEECDECEGWENDPVSGSSFCASISLGGDVTSNYLQMANDAALPAPFLPQNTSFTVGTWVYLRQALPSSDLMSRFTGGGNEQWLLSFDGSVNKFYFVVIDTLGNQSAVVYTAAVTVNTWYLVCASFDYLNSKLRIWLNGVQSNVNHTSGMRNVGEGMMIGNRGGGGTALNAKLESSFVHRGTVGNDAAQLVLFNGGNGVRFNRLAHYGLGIPTVWYEYESAGNLGFNSQGDAAYSLTNNNSVGGLAGLVTQDIGLPYS